MKKIVTIVLSSLLSLSLLAGCSNTNNQDEVKKEEVVVKVGAPDGLPAITIAKLAQENPEIKEGYKVEYTLEATSDALSTDVMKEGLDIAIVPSNMAAIAFNKTSNYQIAGTIGRGSFYLVSSDESVTGIDSSLVGKEVGNIGKGLTPDITIQALLKEEGVDASNISFNYSNEASDLVSLLATGKLSTGIVPEPALSGLLTKNENLKVIASVNDTWKDVFNTEDGYPQSTLIVSSSFAKENSDFVDEFINSLEENINYINSNPEESGKFAEEFGVNIKSPILKKAIERTNLKYISIEDSKTDYDNYFNTLSSFNPKVLGGTVPTSEIYYK